MSVRSRTSRRAKHHTPSPPSSDADSESESDSDHEPPKIIQGTDNSLGPAPPPSSANWQCEHCTFVNEPGVRVCMVCCRTPTVIPKVIGTDTTQNVEHLKIDNGLSSMRISEEPREEESKYFATYT